MTRLICVGLIVAACNGRMAFDTHYVGDRFEADAGAGGSMPVSPPEDGGGESSTDSMPNGAAAADCGGSPSRSDDDPNAAPAGQGQSPADEGTDDLPCGEHGTRCVSCRTPTDCPYFWACDPLLLVCVQCLDDASCPPGSTCGASSRRCE